MLAWIIHAKAIITFVGLAKGMERQQESHQGYLKLSGG